MRKPIRRSTLMLTSAVALLLVANVATAHRWWKWHQHEYSNGVWNTASRHAEAEAALNDWRACSGFSMPSKSSHTDISVFDGNYGATGWSGLAEIKHHGWDWGDWRYSRIKHGHARYNAYYGGSGGTGTNSDIRGIFCQEIGHVWGLGHSNNGCMGKTYYNNSNVVDRAHSCADVRNYTH